MSTLGVVLLVILVLIFLGGIGGPYLSPNIHYGYGFNHGGIGIIGVVLIIVVFLVWTGHI